MANNTPESAPSPDRQAKSSGSKPGSNWPIWGGLGAAVVAIFAVAVWAFWPKGVNGLPPVTPTPTPVLPTVVVVVPSQTPLAGVATFTPVAGTIITGPHVLGITAGVGMHGDIAGVAPIAVTFSDSNGSARRASRLLPLSIDKRRFQVDRQYPRLHSKVAPQVVHGLHRGGEHERQDAEWHAHRRAHVGQLQDRSSTVHPPHPPQRGRERSAHRCDRDHQL